MTTTATQREQEHAELRRILLFIRAAQRLREITMKHPLFAKMEWIPALVQPADPRHRVLSGVKLGEHTDWMVVENIATRLRPFLMPNERCHFPYIAETLPKRVRIEGGPM